MVVDKLKTDKALADEYVNELKNAGYGVTRLDGGKKLVLTDHRRENFGDGFIRVSKDVPADYIEVGNPVKVVKHFTNNKDED